MENNYSSTGMAFRIWFLTSLVFGIFWALAAFATGGSSIIGQSLIASVCAAVGSLPVAIVLAIAIPFINRVCSFVQTKYWFLAITCSVVALPYAALGVNIFDRELSRYGLVSTLAQLVACEAVLLTASAIATFITRQQLQFYFSHTSKTNNTMEQELPAANNYLPASQPGNTHANKILVKGIITGVLTLLMLIPVFFVMNLVTERERRQQEVTAEISKKWASPQTLSGPYIYLPYKHSYTGTDGSIKSIKKDLFLLPENLNVNGTITPELRQRSIYKVLLYKTAIKNTGNFLVQLPKDVTADMVDFTEAKVCFNIRDFKGIGEKINIKLNGASYELSPGLPVKLKETIDIDNKGTSQQESDRAATNSTNEIETIGVSAGINLSAADIGKSIAFGMPVKINGSGSLHFVPLAGNSSYSLSSPLKDPSFDGNNLPSANSVNSQGFAATWNFNKANLPFGTALKDFDFKKDAYAFGVTLVQPADQYAKTMRSIKYAILFIGLTFALFFIIELMQKNPVHPVQYVLVGMALMIFFTLLLSISEFILFDYAYLLAAIATVLLITLYAKSHFKSIKTSIVFASVLSALYSFIFVLIRLEDTALLMGSIGLFVVLAVVMYASRKINWYGGEEKVGALEVTG